MRSSKSRFVSNLILWMSVILVGILFFFILGEAGPVIEKDSGVFIEPVEIFTGYGYVIYPQFIRLCKSIFGSEKYLYVVFIVQSSLACATSIVTTAYIRKKYIHSNLLCFAVFIASFGPYLYTLPQYVASHGILTEGLAFPLFNIWMLFALDFINEDKKIDYVLIILISIVMALTRTQLMLMFIIDAAIILWKLLPCFIRKLKQKTGKAFCLYITIGVIGLIVVGTICFMFLVKRNIIPQMTDAVSGRAICAISEEDVRTHSDIEKGLFEKVLQFTDENQTRNEYFRRGIRRWEDIVTATNINTKELHRIIRDCYPEADARIINEIKGKLAYDLLMKHPGEYIEMTVSLLVQSLVVAIFFHPDQAYILGYIVAFVLYVLAIILCYIAKKMKVEKKYINVLVMTLGDIVLLCGITNVLFIGLQRYVVYVFGWYYISIIVVGWQVLMSYRRKICNGYDNR